MKTGIGYDAHPLTPGRKLVLGGVHVPYRSGLSGHSDADALTHAIIDALLGAAGLGDIGGHFPSEDLSYKDVSSLLLLAEVKKLLAVGGFKINNIDATIIAREPRLLPYMDEMRRHLSQTLEISPDQVAVKASTNNGLGSIGRGEGIAAIAVAMLEVTGDK